MIKKLILLSVILISCPAFAEDIIYLDLNSNTVKNFDTGKYQFNNPQKTDDEDVEDIKDYIKPDKTFHSIRKLFVEDIYTPYKSNKASKNITK